MTQERYKALMRDDSVPLSPDELALGWHFCYEFDGLLVGPNMGELRFCRCLPEGHPVYATTPQDL